MVFLFVQSLWFDISRSSAERRTVCVTRLLIPPFLARLQHGSVEEQRQRVCNGSWPNHCTCTLFLIWSTSQYKHQVGCCHDLNMNICRYTRPLHISKSHGQALPGTAGRTGVSDTNSFRVSNSTRPPAPFIHFQASLAPLGYRADRCHLCHRLVGDHVLPRSQDLCYFFSSSKPTAIKPGCSPLVGHSHAANQLPSQLQLLAVSLQHV